MLRHTILAVFLIGFFAGSSALAQFQYHFNQSVPVKVDGVKRNFPWAGGLVLAQYNAMDINNDGIMDLFLFDRYASKPICFLSDGTQYSYAPEYEHFFPEDLDYWVLMRDYNCDGKMDLFTASVFGMRLFENISAPGGRPEWELTFSTIYTEGVAGQVNLQVNKGDLPGIEDIDGDGDLDILVFDFALGGGVQLHKNMSIERTGNCGLDLVLDTEKYGGFMECTCTNYVFGSDECPVNGRLEHTGGKSILSFNAGSGNAHDIVIGQEDCVSYGYLENTGTTENPVMSSVNFDFPNTTNPSTLNYPAGFNLDLDLDGTKDLLITHNMFSAYDNPDYGANNLFFKGSGSGFALSTKAFLQEEMIDAGFAAAPAFHDLDSDGDEDLFIGSGSLNSSAAMRFYRNNGDVLNPDLWLETTDYLEMSAMGWSKIAPQLIDINEDNREDLIIDFGSLERKVRVYWNTGNPLQPFSAAEFLDLAMPVFSTNDNLHFYWSAGKLALLIGRETGRVTQYINQGSVNNPVWEMLSDSFLDIEDDFTARNPALFIDDLDNDGNQDLLRYDDSGVLKIYSDFRGAAIVNEKLIQNKETLLGYDSGFGRNGVPVTTKITGAELPSIAIGQASGGLQLLSNIEDEQQSINISIQLATFPNPLDRNQYLEIVVNKNAEVRFLNMQGQVFVDEVAVDKNKRVSFDLRSFRTGMYLIEAVDDEGGKAVKRVVVTD